MAVDTASAPQTYQERRPSPALWRHLSCVWVQHVSPDAAPYAHRTVPNGGVELLCELGALPRVIGPQTRPLVEVLAPGTTVVGVRFRPGAAPAGLGVPASALVDLTVGSDELWGDRAAALGERLAESDSPDQAAVVLEREVFDRLGEGAGPDPIVSEAVRRLLPSRAGAVGRLSDSLNISERQLRRRCRAAIGLAPKVVERMLRFQRFLALAHARGLDRPDVARLAAEAGYADQPHLTRESLRLSGLSPRALLREAEEHCRGAHDHAASYAPLLHPQTLG
jgi:AraC-like DNA-binding protein